MSLLQLHNNENPSFYAKFNRRLQFAMEVERGWQGLLTGAAVVSAVFRQYQNLFTYRYRGGWVCGRLISGGA